MPSKHYMESQMRIAIISDIHGNLVPLEAVLADIQPASRCAREWDAASRGVAERLVVGQIGNLSHSTFVGNQR